MDFSLLILATDTNTTICCELTIRAESSFIPRGKSWDNNINCTQWKEERKGNEKFRIPLPFRSTSPLDQQGTRKTT